MADQEESARRFSRELHDHFSQTLNAIEANLVAIRTPYLQREPHRRLPRAHQGRHRERARGLAALPSEYPRRFRTDASLRWLTESFSERTGVRIIYESAFSERLDGETETHLFRIAQEA